MAASAPLTHAPPTQASGVGDGALGVGYLSEQAGNPDKIAAVAFDLTAIPLGSTFSQFKVTVPLDVNAEQLNTAVPDISACEAIDAFLDAPGPGDISKAPPISSPSCVKGAFDPKLGAKGSYVFELTAIANNWAGGAPSNGVVLRPTLFPVATVEPYTLSLQGKKGITTAATFVRPAVVVEAPSGAAGVPPVAAPPVFPGVFLPPAVNLPDLSAPGPVFAPLPVPTPQVNPTPAVSAVGVGSVPIALNQLRPSGAFWLALLGAAGLLGFTALVLGDPMAPAAVDARRRRFAAVVRTGMTPPTSPAPRRPAPRIRPA